MIVNRAIKSFVDKSNDRYRFPVRVKVNDSTHLLEILKWCDEVHLEYVNIGQATDKLYVIYCKDDFAAIQLKLRWC